MGVLCFISFDHVKKKEGGRYERQFFCVLTFHVCKKCQIPFLSKPNIVASVAKTTTVYSQQFSQCCTWIHSCSQKKHEQQKTTKQTSANSFPQSATLLKKVIALHVYRNFPHHMQWFCFGHVRCKQGPIYATCSLKTMGENYICKLHLENHFALKIHPPM